MKLTANHLAYMDGRKFVTTSTRKPSAAKTAGSCPWSRDPNPRGTPDGTPVLQRSHERSRQAAWGRGADEALAEYVAPSKRPASKRHPRAQRRFEHRLAVKMGAFNLPARPA